MQIFYPMLQVIISLSSVNIIDGGKGYTRTFNHCEGQTTGFLRVFKVFNTMENNNIKKISTTY